MANFIQVFNDENKEKYLDTVIKLSVLLSDLNIRKKKIIGEFGFWLPIKFHTSVIYSKVNVCSKLFLLWVSNYVVTDLQEFETKPLKRFITVI